MADKKYPEKERVEGVYVPTGEQIRFNREWSGHRFTDQEVSDLLVGRDIAFTAISKSKNEYTAQGRLEKQEYNGHEFFGFKLDTEAVPLVWSGHTFSDEERETLKSGGSIYIQDAVSKKSGKTFACKLAFVTEDGRKRLKPDFGDND